MTLLGIDYFCTRFNKLSRRNQVSTLGSCILYLSNGKE